jgi:hypothetical protein
MFKDIQQQVSRYFQAENTTFFENFAQTLKGDSSDINSFSNIWGIQAGEEAEDRKRVVRKW